MTQLSLALPCGDMPYGNFGYGGYGRRNDGCEALESALHVTNTIASNSHRSDTNNGFHRVTDGQQQIVNSISAAQDSIMTDLDSVKNLQNQNSLHNLNATRDSKDHIVTAVNSGTMANLEATRNVGEDLSGEICDVSKDSLRSTHLLSNQIGENRFYMSNGFSDIRREFVKESCDTRQEILINRFEACKNTDALARQASELAARQEIQAEKHAAAVALQNATLAAAATLQAANIAAEAARQRAECCYKQQLEEERRHRHNHEQNGFVLNIQNIVNTAVSQALRTNGNGNGNGNGNSGH